MAPWLYVVRPNSPPQITRVSSSIGCASPFKQDPLSEDTGRFDEDGVVERDQRLQRLVVRAATENFPGIITRHKTTNIVFRVPERCESIRQGWHRHASHFRNRATGASADSGTVS